MLNCTRRLAKALVVPSRTYSAIALPTWVVLDIKLSIQASSLLQEIYTRQNREQRSRDGLQYGIPHRPM